MASKTDKGQQPQAKPEANSNVSTDLLGLDLVSSSNDEPFGFFASAETSSATTNNNESANSANPAKSLDDEEKDFFSQKVPDKADDKKLTKESILSLYSQAPSTAAMNGIMQAPAMANHLNQFPPTNQLFGGIPNQVQLFAIFLFSVLTNFPSWVRQMWWLRQIHFSQTTATLDSRLQITTNNRWFRYELG